MDSETTSAMAIPYKLDLNLRQMAMVQTAINCWEQWRIKRKIKDFFLSHDSYTICRKEAEVKIDWTSEILVNIREQRIMPDALMDEMTYMINCIGDRMIEWLKYITEKLEGSPNRIPALDHYLSHIFWTNYGTIDAVHIFKSLCLEGVITDIPFMYEEACNYCLEEDIQSLWRRSSLEDRDLISWKSRWTIGNPCNVHLMVYWRWYISDRSSHLFIKSTSPHNYDDIYDFKHSANENTFRQSAIGGYDVAVKYFFNQLSEDEKNRNLLDTSMILLTNKILPNSETVEEDYTRRYIDILVFLMQKMSPAQRHQLLRQHKVDILKTLLINWPWQSLFIPTLEQTWEYFTPAEFRMVVMAIVEAILEEFELSEIKETSTGGILFETWDRAPAVLKVGVVKDCWSFFSKCLRTMQDVSFTKYVINDPDLKDHRQTLLDTGKDTYYYLIIEKKYNVVEDLMQQVLHTDTERIDFKQKLDGPNICSYLILKCQYCSADKYLSWQFSTKEEKTTFKNLCKMNKTCSQIISDIWRENDSITQAKHESEIFFRWFGYNKEDRDLLKVQLGECPHFPRMLARIFSRNGETRVRQFLGCCGFGEAEVEDHCRRTKEIIQQDEIEVQTMLEDQRRTIQSWGVVADPHRSGMHWLWGGRRRLPAAQHQGYHAAR